MPKLAVTVSADKFEEGFEKKLTDLLQQAFGQEAQVKFAADEEEEDDKEKKEEMAAKVAEVATLKEQITKLNEKIATLEKSSKGEKEDEEKKEMEIATLREEVTKLKTQSKQLQEQSDAQAKQFKEDQQKAWDKERDSFINVQMEAGRILPKHKEFVREQLELAHAKDSESAGKKVAKYTEEGKAIECTAVDLVKRYVLSLTPIVTFGEQGPSTITVDGGSSPKKLTVHGVTYDVVDSDVDAAARKYAEDNKVSYEDALLKVSARR